MADATSSVPRTAAARPDRLPPAPRSIVCATIAIAAVSRGVVDLATVASGSLRASAPCGGLMDNLGGRSFGSRFCQDPIDVVYTWVNGSDPVWFAQMQRFRALERGLDPDAPGANASAGNSSGADAGDQAGANRYRDNEELRFSLRSLFKYAPWVRNVHLVTSGQVPAWLDVTHPRVRVVTHEEIFADPSHLPVFSSPAIEVHLHRIPGLSRRFVYFNDDVMLGADTWPADFYSPATGHRVYFSWEVPKCNTGCIDSWIGDGFCDRACNISRCMWDAGDCVGSDIKPGAGMGSSSTSSSSSSSYSGRGGGLFYCAEGCPGTWLGDKTCDTKCDTPACGFDAGDCGADAVYGGGVPGAEAVRGATPEERRSRAEALVGAAADAIRAASEAAAARCHAAAAANASAAPNATECAAEARAVASRVAAPDGPRLHVLADEAAVTLEEPVFSGALHINISDVVIGAARAVLRMQGCVHGTAGASRNASRAELLDDDVPDHAPCRPTSVDDVRVSWTSAEHDDDAEPWLPVSVLAPHASLLVAVADVANLPSAEDAARAGAARRRAMLLRASAAPPGNGSTAAARTAACDGLEPFAAGAATLASSSEPSAAAVRLARCALRPGPGATAPGPSAVDDEWGFWARVGPALAAANGALPPGTRVPVARLRLRLRVDVMRQGLALDLPVVVLRSVPEPPAAADGGDDDDDDGEAGGGAAAAGAASGLSSSNGTSPGGCTPGLATGTGKPCRPNATTHARNAAKPTPSPRPAVPAVSPAAEAELADAASTDAGPARESPGRAASAGIRDPAVLRRAIDDLRRRGGGRRLARAGGAGRTVLAKARDEAIRAVAAAGLAEPSGATTEPAPRGHGWGWAAPLAAAEDAAARWLAPAPPAPAARPPPAAGTGLEGLVRAAWRGAVSSLPASSSSSLSPTSAAGRGGGRGRRLDTYGDSLVFTNSILSSVVGRRNRKVPAHMPHMIDRVEMGKLQAWPAMAPAWEATSARRFRDPEDVQYAFAFFYWVMEAAEEVGEGRREALERFWRREVDVNGDGVVDDNEFRTLAAVVQGGKVLPEDLERIRACVAPAGNVTTRVERRPDGSSATVTEVATPAITLDGLARCKASMDPVSKRVKLRGEPTHSIGAEEEVAFEMVGDDYNETLAKLDSVRSRRAKFVCINDDMTLAPEPLRRALREFYESYFPHPCELELPPGRENAHLYIKPLLAHARALWAVRAAGAAAVLLACAGLTARWVAARAGAAKRGGDEGGGAGGSVPRGGAEAGAPPNHGPAAGDSARPPAGVRGEARPRRSGRRR